MTRYLLSTYEGGTINGRKSWELVWYNDITEKITREVIFEERAGGINNGRKRIK